MNLRTIFFVLLFSWAGAVSGQTKGGTTSGNIDTTITQEPKPLNLDSVVKLLEYPKRLRDAGKKGKVVVKLLVDKDGTPIKHIILQSPHPLFTQEVEKHIYHLRFSPAFYKDKAVKFWVYIPFNFKFSYRLKDKKKS